MINTVAKTVYQIAEENARYDNLVEASIHCMNSAKEGLWAAAEHIWELYFGFYTRENGFMQAICEATHRERSSIFDLRNAWQMRRLISQYLPSFRHVLTPTFYYVAFDARNNMPIQAIIEFMDIAAQDNKSVSWLGAQLGAKDLTPDGWTIRTGKAAKNVAKLLQDCELLGMPSEKREFVSEALRNLRAAQE